MWEIGARAGFVKRYRPKESLDLDVWLFRHSPIVKDENRKRIGEAVASGGETDETGSGKIWLGAQLIGRTALHANGDGSETAPARSRRGTTKSPCFCLLSRPTSRYL